jgi:hypothetical protein
VGSSQFIFSDREFPNVCTSSSPCLQIINDYARNLVYIGIFFFVELCFTLVAASYFATADGYVDTAIVLKKAGGVFAFLAGLLGYYTVAHLMCQTALFFRFPMGDTSRFFIKAKTSEAGASERENSAGEKDR